MAAREVKQLPIVSPRKMRRLMAIYPPLLFNRIVPRRFADDYSSCEVVIRRSWLNRNINGTIFGGTLFCAADPWHGVMYWQRLARLGRNVQVWVRAAEMDFRKPGRTDLTMLIQVPDAHIEACVEALDSRGKYKHVYETPITDTHGDIVAVSKIVVYVRRTPDNEDATLGF
jgi:acyl-coenzyme A thioesterase PaaI-like protein